MTHIGSQGNFEIVSNDSWNLTCSVQTVGADILCRIHGGEVHVGSVALAQWVEGRAFTECLVAEGHREDTIATHAAHRLCGASRQRVVCVSGIHFDGIAKEEIDEISQSAFQLANRASEMVGDERLKSSAAANDLLKRIGLRADRVAPSIGSFLAQPWEELIQQHRDSAAQAFSMYFDDRVNLFAPLYLSNACLNNCLYCGFRQSARFKRTTLTAEQAVREAAFLADRGFRVLDLVTGEVPTDRFVDYVCGVIEAILKKTEIGGLNLNIGSLSSEQYQRLREAGAVGYHLYQETYDPATYFEVHASGKKRDMASRLEGVHRAVEAGFGKVGLGLLLGLGDPQEELGRLVGHAEVLREDFPSLNIGFSLPRIQKVDEECEYAPHSTISDADFMKYMLFLRLRFPDANLTLTTREGQGIRDNLLPLGITKVSAEVSTSPGGYTHLVESETGQFSISDERTLEEMKRIIEAADLIPVLG